MPAIPTTIPYPWPFDSNVDPARTALVITGAQLSIVERCADPAPATELIIGFSRRLRELGVLTVATVHHRRHIENGSPGRQFLSSPEDLLASLAAAATIDCVIRAAGIDAFTGSALEHELRSSNRTHLLVGGFASELTVDSTLRTANDRGFECLVLTDAIAPIDPVIAARALHSVTMSGGIFGALGTSIDVAAALRLAH